MKYLLPILIFLSGCISIGCALVDPYHKSRHAGPDKACEGLGREQLDLPEVVIDDSGLTNHECVPHLVEVK